MSGGARCCFGFLVAMAQILLHGVVGLVLFWVFKYHSNDKEDNPWPFAWRSNYELEFNLHPVLMILGFIYFMGQGTYIDCNACLAQLNFNWCFFSHVDVQIVQMLSTYLEQTFAYHVSSFGYSMHCHWLLCNMGLP